MLNLNEDLFDDIIEIEDPNNSGPITPEARGLSDVLLSLINDENNTIQSYNRKATISIKNTKSTSTEYNQGNKNHFRSYKTPKTLKMHSPKKIKFKLLMEEEKNKLLKDIEETKNTMNNRDLMEKNITIENYTNKSKTSKDEKEKKDNEQVNDNNNYDNIFSSLLQKMRFVNDSKKKTFRYSKFLSQRVKGPMFLNLFGQKAIKQSIIRKLNAENELTLAVVTNYCAELDNNLNLPQMYIAYQNHKLDDLELTPTSADTVTASNKGKQIEIKYNLLDDGSKQYEINYEDGSKVKYVSFAQGSKMEINGEEFEMPEGAVLEEKSIPGKVFSKLIQTPDMRRNFINMPDILNEAEQTLKTNNSV